MFGLSHTWSLVKSSGEVLRQDKELLVFPLCSALAMLLVVASFIAPLFFYSTDAFLVLIGFLIYFGLFFVVFFFNTALVSATMIRLKGGDPTVADGLSISRSKLGNILGYAMIAATVGMMLQLIEKRGGFIGEWIGGLLGFAFGVATFLTVPVLVSQDVGPLDALKESTKLLKKTWGENIIGTGSMDFVFGLLYVFLVILMTAFAGSIGVEVLLVLAFVMLGATHAALQGIYSAALYCYATTGKAGDKFSGTLLQSAFKNK